MMPPQGVAAARRGGARGARLVSDDDARSRSRGASESGPAAGASPEPRRVRERHPRSARARRRRVGAAAARRRGVRVRQHRRRARRLAGAARAVSDGGRQDQLARGRRPGHRPGGRDVPHPPGRVAGHPHRRPADRHRRRHPGEDDAAARRRRTISRSSCSARTSASCAASSTNISSNTPSTASACTCRSVGGEEDFKANLKNMTKAGDDVEARAHVRIPLKAGPHVDHGGVPRADATRSNPLRLQPFIRSSNDTLDTIGHPHLDTFTLTGPFNATGPGDTPSRRRIFICRPRGRRVTKTLRAPHRLDARAPRLSRAGDARRPRAPARVLSDGPEAGDLRDRHPDGAAAHSRQPEVRRSGSSAIRRAWRRARSTASATSSSRRACRSSSGAAFPTTSCCASAAAGHAAHAGGAEAAGAAHARRPEGRGARRQLRGPVAVPAQPEEPAAELARVPRLRRQPAAGVPARDRAVLREHHARGPQRPRPDDGRLHVPQRAAREALRRAEHLRQPLPPRHARRRRAARGCSARARS